MLPVWLQESPALHTIRVMDLRNNPVLDMPGVRSAHSGSTAAGSSAGESGLPALSGQGLRAMAALMQSAGRLQELYVHGAWQGLLRDALDVHGLDVKHAAQAVAQAALSSKCTLQRLDAMLLTRQQPQATGTAGVGKDAGGAGPVVLVGTAVPFACSNGGAYRLPTRGAAMLTSCAGWFSQPQCTKESESGKGEGSDASEAVLPGWGIPLSDKGPGCITTSHLAPGVIRSVQFADTRDVAAAGMLVMRWRPDQWHYATEVLHGPLSQLIYSRWLASKPATHACILVPVPDGAGPSVAATASGGTTAPPMDALRSLCSGLEGGFALQSISVVLQAAAPAVTAGLAKPSGLHAKALIPIGGPADRGRREFGSAPATVQAAMPPVLPEPAGAAAVPQQAVGASGSHAAGRTEGRADAARLRSALEQLTAAFEGLQASGRATGLAHVNVLVDADLTPEEQASLHAVLQRMWAALRSLPQISIVNGMRVAGAPAQPLLSSLPVQAVHVDIPVWSVNQHDAGALSSWWKEQRSFLWDREVRYMTAEQVRNMTDEEAARAGRGIFMVGGMLGFLLSSAPASGAGQQAPAGSSALSGFLPLECSDAARKLLSLPTATMHARHLTALLDWPGQGALWSARACGCPS